MRSADPLCRRCGATVARAPHCVWQHVCWKKWGETLNSNLGFDEKTTQKKKNNTKDTVKDARKSTIGSKSSGSAATGYQWHVREMKCTILMS